MMHRMWSAMTMRRYDNSIDENVDEDDVQTNGW